MPKTYDSKPCRVPASDPSGCTRISKRQKQKKRKPALDFPAHIPEIYKDGDEEDVPNVLHSDDHTLHHVLQTLRSVDRSAKEDCFKSKKT